MPKTPKKAAKPSARKKTPVKRKSPTRTKMKASVKPTADAKGSRRGFMWKALERIQQRQKEQATTTPVNPFERVRPNATTQGFGRFNGPRRRVG